MINVTDGGFGVLIAGAIENQGKIVAKLGTIALASGDAVRLTLSDDGLISVAIEEPVASKIVDFEGNPVLDQITNKGTLTAEGGTIILKAESMGDIFRNAINLEGIVKATRLQQSDGTIRIVADSDVSIKADIIEATRIEIGQHHLQQQQQESIKDAIIPRNVLVEEETTIIKAEEFISIKATHSIHIASIIEAPNVTLESQNTIDTTNQAIIQATNLNLVSNKFGTYSIPLNIDADNINIERLNNYLTIIDSTGIGTTILTRGPPDDWGAILSNEYDNLTLKAEKISLESDNPLYLYGNITFHNFECIVPGKEILFQEGKTYTFKDDIYVQGTKYKTIDLYSQEQGSYWYIHIPTGQHNINRVSVRDAYNIGSSTIYIDRGHSYGNCIGFIIDPVWDGLGDASSWADGNNWDTTGVPGPADDVTIDMSVTVNISSSTTINSLTLGGSNSPTLNFTYDAITDGALIIDDGNLVVNSGATITHSAGTTVVVGTVYIDVQTGDAEINGDINVNEKGYSYDQGTGAGSDAVDFSGGGGGAYGGDGGDGQAGISGGTAYGSITAPATIGSGGGSYSITRHGGRGGGYARLDVSGTLTVTGDITANGGDGLTDGGGQSGGGGAGGGIYITTGTLSGAGTISVDGGAGGNGGGTDGGGGAGGRIAIYYTTNSHTGSMTAYGGSGPDAAGYGGAGTIYLKDSGETYGDLIIDNNNQTETSRPLWDHFYGTTPLATTTTFNSVTIRNKGELTVNNGVTLDYDTLTWNDDGTIAENGTVNFGSDLTIPDGATYEANVSKTFGSLTVNGVLTHSYNINSQTYTLDITVDNDLTIASTGSIDLNERGYSYSQGTGAGSDAADFSGGGGGAYGGDGGDGEAGISGGNAYGSITAPAAIGSGGGSYSITRHGGRGGGYARLDVSGTLTVTGDITANGGDGLTDGGGQSGGGGAGGGIYITTGTLSGAGTISVDGGAGGNGSSADGGGGGGGRIAIEYTTNSHTGSMTAYGGSGPDAAGYGGAGTIYKKDETADEAELIIDNNDQDNWDDQYFGRTRINATYTFDTITIQNYGDLETGSSSNISYTTLTWSNQGIITDNGGIFAIVSGGGSLTIPATAKLVGNTARTFTGLTVSGTLTHSLNTTSETYKTNYTINGDATVASGGTINVDYKGYQHSEGPGAGTDGVRASGAGYGGDGGDGLYSGTTYPGGSSYGSITEPTNIGSGGGDRDGIGGGAGGGAVKLTVSGTTTVTGTISANGGNATVDDGGGSGGSIWIDTGTLAGAVTITANGGNGRTNPATGGGAGGRIAIYYTTDSSSITYQAYGGTPSVYYGGAGTIYKKDKTAGTDELIIDNNDQDNWDDQYFGRTPINATYTFDTITIQNYGNLETGSSSNISYTTLTWSNQGIITDNGGIFAIVSGGGSLTIPATARLVANTARTFTGLTVSGTLTHSLNTTSETYKTNYTINGDATVASGGTINVDYKGYQHSEGPGAGTDGVRASGAGYGGDGGDGLYSGTTYPGGSSYGSITEPTNIGSGGGDRDGIGGGAGGGAVKLTVSGTTTVTGTISANGGNATVDDGGGSGGSIWIDTGTLVGAGTFTANGGNGWTNPATGGGAGGRIAIYYTTDSSSITYQAYGGSPSEHYGGAGTLYEKPSSKTYGDLTVNNNNNSGDRTPLLSQNWSFDDVTIQNSANLDLDAYNLAIYEDFLNSNGTFTHSNQTVTFASTLAGRTIESDGSSFYDLVFNGIGGGWTLQDALVADNGLTLTNGTLDLSDKDLTVTGTFSNNALLKLIGAASQTITYTNDITAGTVEYYGTGSYSGLRADNDYYNLTFSGTGTYALTGNIDVDGNFTASAGTITSTSGNLTIAGTFNPTGSTFTHNNGTVIFDSASDSTIYDDTTFNDLTCIIAGKALTFEEAKTQTIEGTLTLTGSDPIILRSTTDGVQWEIDPQGTRDVSSVDVQDSNNINATVIDPSNSIDSGNNINWFVSDPTPPDPPEPPEPPTPPEPPPIPPEPEEPVIEEPEEPPVEPPEEPEEPEEKPEEAPEEGEGEEGDPFGPQDEKKKYKKKYIKGKYRTVVIVFEGRVVACPYGEEGPRFEEGTTLTKGQRTIQEGAVK